MLGACKIRPHMLSAGVAGKAEIWEASLWEPGKKPLKLPTNIKSQAEILASRLSGDILTLL